jgi:hypothetical protein
MISTPITRNLVGIRRSPGGFAGPIGAGHRTYIRNEHPPGESRAGDTDGLKDPGADVNKLRFLPKVFRNPNVLFAYSQAESVCEVHPCAIWMHLFLFDFGESGVLA